MKLRAAAFNTYLLVIALPLLALSSGCKSSAKKTKENEATALRLHLEVNADGTDRNGPVTIGRTSSFVVNVEKAPFLDEFKITEANVIDDGLGGFLIVVRFDQRGTWLLEQYTTANKGKRVALLSIFVGSRWLAAPIISKRISDGVFSFTPDCTREEAERIVHGLNNVARDVAKGKK